MQANDTATLGELLSDGMTYVHSSGGKDGKQDYLQKISSGALRYESVEFLAPVARVIGSVGLVTASMRATISGDTGNRRHIANTYLAVWEHGASGWVLQLVQATPLPAAS